MPDSVLHHLMEWITSFPLEEPLGVTFHGGEPLTAGIDYYRRALPMLRDACKGRRLRISVQSNLWLINAEFLDLFEQYHVYLGTSLDGPEEINDSQRGNGYFQRTMEKLNLVRQRGLSIGCIATLTASSAPRWREVIQFFEREQLDISLHAALPGLQMPLRDWALSPDGFGLVMEEIFTYSLSHEPLIRIEPVESMVKGLAVGGAGTCMFGECLGKFLAIGPDGSIYPCQRFVGIAEFRLGDIRIKNSIQPEFSHVWRLVEDWQKTVLRECNGCVFWDICHGGCPYNTLVIGRDAFQRGKRDPYCQAYQRLFSAILDRAAEEFFSDGNLAAIVENPSDPNGLFRHGNLLRRMKSS